MLCYMTLTYPRDIFGDRTGAWDNRPSAHWLGWDVFWSRIAGQRLNMGGNSAYIDHADAIGSTTMDTDPSGTVVWDQVNGPWGQPWQQAGTRQSAVFADLDWQVNDPLMPSATREYSDGLGRWMTPDPGGRKVVRLDNPQTWNMYAYVGNNPTSRNDPSGLCFGPASCAIELGTAGSAFGPIGTGGGVVLGLAIGAGIGYYGAKLANQVHQQSLAKQGMGNSGPKAENAPGVSAGGQATDEYGKKLGPSGKPAHHEVDHSTVKGAKDAARVQGKRAPVKHASPARGKPHFHPTDEEGNKIPCSAHHNCPK
jgi:RHS repeat-associated protein